MKTLISRLRIRISNFFRRHFWRHSPSIGEQYYYNLNDICPDGPCYTPSIEPATDDKKLDDVKKIIKFIEDVNGRELPQWYKEYLYFLNSQPKGFKIHLKRNGEVRIIEPTEETMLDGLKSDHVFIDDLIMNSNDASFWKPSDRPSDGPRTDEN